jgi:hypothetical protein
LAVLNEYNFGNDYIGISAEVLPEAKRRSVSVWDFFSRRHRRRFFYYYILGSKNPPADGACGCLYRPFRWNARTAGICHGAASFFGFGMIGSGAAPGGSREAFELIFPAAGHKI